MVLDKKELRKEIYMQIIPNLIWGKPLNKHQDISFRIWKKEYNIDEIYLKWYTDKRVLFQIVKYLGNKELCWDSKIRWMYSNKIEYLLKYMYVYNFFEKPKIMYCGLSGFDYRQSPPINPKEKVEWQNSYWTSGKSEYLNRINSYNFGIDLDGETFKDSYKDAKRLFNYLKKFNIKFSVWCSGKKGWHFIFPNDEFQFLIGNFEIENAVIFCKSLALDIRDKLKLKKIDLIIYSATRFLKLPFSIDTRNKRMIYPLNDKEFLNFKEEYMSMDYFLKQKDLGNMDVHRGRATNKKGFEKMVEDL